MAMAPIISIFTSFAAPIPSTAEQLACSIALLVMACSIAVGDGPFRLRAPGALVCWSCRSRRSSRGW